MPSLKSYREKISSVGKTKKITQAMKMVAAAKLGRAQAQAEKARPYAERMDEILNALAAGKVNDQDAPKLLRGHGKEDVVMLVVASSDRGLCGPFNSSIARQSIELIQALQEQGKQVKIICIGRKGRDLLRRNYGDLIVDTVEDLGKPKLSFADAEDIGNELIEKFEKHEFDVAVIVYNKFMSIMRQQVTVQQLIPVSLPEGKQVATDNRVDTTDYTYEPSETDVLEDLLPRNLKVQLYRAFLENTASEHAARMTAMDSATRNAEEMIKKLKLNYNRARQAHITKEMIEIISGAEAI